MSQSHQPPQCSSILLWTKHPKSHELRSTVLILRTFDYSFAVKYFQTLQWNALDSEANMLELVNMQDKTVQYRFRDPQTEYDCYHSDAIKSYMSYVESSLTS